MSESQLRTFFRVAQSLTKASGTPPTYKHALCRADGDDALLVASDWITQVSLRVHDAYPFCDPNPVLIPIMTASSVLSKNPKASVDIGPEGMRVGQGLVAVSADCKPQDFGELQGGPAQSHPLQRDDLLGALGSAIHAASEDTTRASLNGVLLDFGATGGAKVATTDGHRMVVTTLLVGDEMRAWKPALLRLEAARALLLMLKHMDGELSVGIAGGMLVARLGDLTLLTRLGEETFPPYAKVMPKKFSGSFECDRRRLLGTVKAARSFVDPGAKHDALWIIPGANRVQLPEQLGSYVGWLELPDPTAWQGIERVAVSARYLTEALTAAPGKTVEIKLGEDDKSPVLVSADNYEAVIMPVRP